MSSVRSGMAAARCAVAMAGCAVVVAGCGGASSARPAAPTQLDVAGPTDQARTLAGAVTVKGTVSPANATVLVQGHPAAVRSGRFAAQVSLTPGTNVIDVLAGAPHAAGSATAIRVYRQLPVSVPDLSGASPSRAVAQLTRLGLRAEVVDTGGFFQSLIPTSTQVCSTSPAAGATLAPGSGIQVQVAKVC